MVCCARPLQCATLERLSLDEMIARSTAIVRGKVTGARPAISGSVIYTHYTIQVSERLKGSGAGAVDLVVPGGTMNNVRQSFSGAPTFNSGEGYVFFLWTSRAGITQILGLTQGVFSLERDSSSDPVATRTATRELMLDRHTGRPVKDETLVMRLSELRLRIGAKPGTVK
jgi:hypothetical protein